ncbi:thioesterase family protein [Rhizobacter sp. J219]|uniref:acyl-CoA thioesterase n=1 Tax=Rhizobacter sp. J219 TaxID=2898430 RepID=UPI0021512B80|nr:thioesterase family protein [Rhizobacter sp. J219]MCR5882404.1 thioesterase family protein [Rhizobacter sp. J219]
MATDFNLQAQGVNRYSTLTDPRYWNQIGPFGGWLAALAGVAMERGAPAGWTMKSISLNFLGRVPAGRVEIDIEPLRVQRRIAALRATMRPEGEATTAVTAEAIFAPAGATTQAAALPRPSLPAPETLPRLDRLDALAAFVGTFDHRVAFGAPFAQDRRARSGGWVRSRLPLPRSPAGLLMLADAWYPPRWATLSEPVPVSTVSMQVVFHESCPGSPGLDGFFAACYQEDAQTDGFGLERGAIWWPDGRLALTMQQLTWVGSTQHGKEKR